MCAQFARGGVVGQHGYRHRLVETLNGAGYGAYDTFVEVFYCHKFEFYVAVVPGFVRSFYVQVNESSVRNASMAACAFPS